jgi:hypothetical protein
MKTKLPSLVAILVLTVLTSVLWISFGVYRALTTEQTPSVPADVSEPLTPTLDKNTIDAIKSRQFIDNVPTTVITISTPTPVASPSLEPTPTASESGTPTPTATATSEGEAQ